MKFLPTIVLIAVVGAIIPGIIMVVTNGYTLSRTEDQQRYTGTIISNLEERILCNSSLLLALEKNPKIYELLRRYNLSIVGRCAWIEEIASSGNGLYKVRLRIEITPILYILTDVIIDNELNIVEVLGEPRFSLIPPVEVESELSKLSRRAEELLSNTSNIRKLLNNSNIVSLLRNMGVNIDIELLIENVRQQLSKGIGVEMSFDPRTGKFNGYILTLQLVKLRIGSREEWVLDDHYLSMIENKNNTDFKCLEQLVVKIHYTIESDDTPEIKHVETLNLPVCLIQIRTHPLRTHEVSPNR